MNLQLQSNLISRFLHYTTEPFDDWEWDGKDLVIILDNDVIERYTFNDLKEVIEDFH